MNRRSNVLSTSLVVALALGFILGAPSISRAVADAKYQSSDTTPIVANTADPNSDTTSFVADTAVSSIDTSPVVANATAPSIDTTPYWDGVLNIYNFGMPNTATYGQTISMTESATLTEFSFFMQVTSTAVFRGYVFAWDGLKAKGAPLFESAPMSTTQGGNFEEVVFHIPCGIVLDAGQQYVLFASTTKDPAQPNSAGRWGILNNNSVYSGGQFVYINNNADPSQWTSTTWSFIAQDLAFKATIIKFATIDTTPYWDRVQYISSFGMPDTATYGQTISMTESAILTQFSFFIKVLPTTVFRGHVFAWDGSKATGDPLFEGGPMSTTQDANFEEVVFDIPDGIALDEGQQYVLFASTSQDPAQPNSAGKWGAVIPNTVYNGGQFVYLNNGADPTKWTSTAWSPIAQDLAFKAELRWQVFLPLIVRQ